MRVQYVPKSSLRCKLTYKSTALILFTLMNSFIFLTNAQENNQENTATSTAVAQESVESEDEKQERVVAARFLELLAKRPRPGTALDKVYGYHIQRGTLDKFCDDLRQEATSNSRGESWLLLGLVQMQRGRDADALLSLQKAGELLPNDAMTSYYYGKTQALIGNVDQAVAAMDRAIQRKPVKAEMLLILQDLGRLYQRMGRVNDATDVWKNLEVSFPGDARVKEQIALILAEEGAIVEALVRYEELAATTKDRFRKVELSLSASQLKESLGRRDEALADFEQLLGQVNPDSWIYQDLRSRIDRAFTSRSDYDGLAKYYQRWNEKHPDDVDAMLRIGRFLSMQRRIPEAKEWFAKAIERAPTNPAPRLALVDIHERERQFGSAAKAMRTLIDLEPDNVDHIVRLGSLLLANQDIPETERARAAANIWNKLLDKRGDDPLTVSKVADLLRGAKLVDEAIATYRRAIELADDEPQYREYLGEYFFGLDRKAEALSVWRELASGPRENRDNLVRLSEVLATFHLDEESLATMDRACADNPTFEQRIRYTKMLRHATKYDEAVKQLALADALAESGEERTLVIDQQIETYQANGQLLSKIDEVEALAIGADKDNPVTWQKLALFQEADRKFQQSAKSIAHAVELLPQSSLMLTIEARILEKAGLYAEAIDSLRKLAALDRRFISNYLMQIASLQMRLGRFKAAVTTGQELISGTSANSEHFKFFADLCFQAGDEAQGIEALRRNVRRNPHDRDARRSLASKLTASSDSAEAIELYWRAYSASTTFDEKRNDVLALTPLYQRKNQFELLIQRLTALGSELGDEREATLLVATVRQAVGELHAARLLLDSLVTAESRDVELLNTLISLAVAEYDWDAAVRYQRQLNAGAPSPDGDIRLAKFLIEKGEIDESIDIWTRLNDGTSTVERIAQVVELLIKHEGNAKAVAYAEKSLSDDPENWEVMSTVMCAMWRTNNLSRAIEIADRLSTLKIPFDTPSVQYQKSVRSALATVVNATAASQTRPNLNSRVAWLDRFMINYRLLISQNQARQVGVTTQTQPTIDSFGDAQLLASFLKLHGKSLKGGEGSTVFGAVAPRAVVPRQVSNERDLNPTLSESELWGLIAKKCCFSAYFRLAEIQGPTLEQLLRRLIELGDTEAPYVLLESHHLARTSNSSTRRPVNLNSRMTQSLFQWLAASQIRPQTQSSGQQALKPLSAEDLKWLTDLYQQTVAATGSATEQVSYLLWFADEYRLTGSETDVKALVAQAKLLADHNLPLDQLVEFLQFDREFAIKRFIDSLAQQGQFQAGHASATTSHLPNPYATAMFLSALIGTCKEPLEVVVLCTALKDTQLASTIQLRPSQLSDYDPTRSTNLYTYAVSAGSAGRSSIARIAIPAISSLQSMELITTLYTIQSSARADVKQAVKKQLAEDAEAPDEEPLKSAIDRLCYATWLWWEGSKDEALNQMNEFRKLRVAIEVAIMIESQMLIDTGKRDAAIELLDNLAPANPQMLQYRELTILNLSITRGNTERARQAAERLYAMPLSSATQMRVSEAMDQLGMKDMSAAIVQRLRRGGAHDLPTMFKLMDKFNKSKDEADEATAIELAWKIYQRTKPKTQSAAQLSQMGSAQASSGQELRTRTVRILIESGETDSLIKSLEARLAKAPINEPLIHQLAELYRETGKVSLADEMLKPYMPGVVESTSRVASLTPEETEEQIASLQAKKRIIQINLIMTQENIDWSALTKLLSELFQPSSGRSQELVKSKIISFLLGTESAESRAEKSKLQDYLERAATLSDAKEKLKQFLKNCEATPANQQTLGQLVLSLCIAGNVEEKDAALRIAKSIVEHPNAAFSAAALSSSGRETTWAAVPLVVKLGDADLAIKLAAIAMKPTSDPKTDALRLQFELATLQLEVGKSSDAASNLRDILTKLNLQSEKDLEARSELAIKLAKLAAERGLVEISCEATISASLLSTTGSQRWNESIVSLIGLWQEKHAPADRVYETIKEVVLRRGDPNRWRLYPEVGRSYGGSHDFTFPDVKSKPLAFVLVDLAKANNSLPSLVEQLDLFAEKPLLRIASLMMKAYSQRILGKTAEATKLIDEVMDTPKSVPEEIMVLYAFTTAIPGGDESTVVPQEIAGPMLKKFLDQRIMHTGTRLALLSQIRNCITANDRVMLDCYVLAVADAIPKVKNFDKESLARMLRRFYKCVSIECSAQGRAELAAEYLRHADEN